MAEPRSFTLELKDRSGALLDKDCHVTVGLEGLTLSGGAASEALGKLGWNTLLRVRVLSTAAPTPPPAPPHAAARGAAPLLHR